MACLDRQTLLSYCRGESVQVSLDSIDLHLDSCLACRQAMTEIEQSENMFGSNVIGWLPSNGNDIENEGECNTKTISPNGSTQDESEVTKQLNDPLDHEIDNTIHFESQARHPKSQSSDGLPRIPGYQILNKVAQGGMGIVYRARQLAANRMVAIKVIRGSIPDEQERIRFQLEARAAAQLEHPNIIPVYEVGETDGFQFYSMKLVNDASLASRLVQAPLASDEAAQIVRKVAMAIHHAHEHRIIHRDLKPGNILMDGGEPLVTDFGLAKQIDGDHNLTHSRCVLGTPSYMPPEQALAQAELIGPLSDVYAIGAVLYACLTGRPPFQGATGAATILQVLNESPVAPRRLNSHIPRDLETICLRCLEKVPGRRYPSAQAVAEDLARLMMGHPIVARPISRWERGWKWTKRNPLAAAFVATICAAAFLIVGGIISYQKRLNESLVDMLAEKEKAIGFEQQRTDALYEQLISQVEFLNGTKPEGFGERAWNLLQQASLLQTSHPRAPHELRSLATASVGEVGFYQAQSIGGFGKQLRAVESSRDGQTVFIGLENGEVVLWDTQSQNIISRNRIHDGPVSGIRFIDSNNAYTYTSFCSQFVHWRLNDGQWTPGHPYQLPILPECVDLRLSRDGQYVIGWTDCSLPVDQTGQFFPNEHFDARSIQPHGAGCFYLRSINDPRQIKLIPLPASPIFDLRSNKFACCDREGRVCIYDLIADKVIYESEQVDVCREDLRIDPSGNYAVLANSQGLHQLEFNGWQAKKLTDRNAYQLQFVGQQQLLSGLSQTDQLLFNPAIPDRIRWLNHTTDESVWYSADGLYCFAVNSLSGILQISMSRFGDCWDTPFDGKEVYDACFSPNGNLMASSASDRCIQIWDTVAQELKAEWPCTRTAFHPSGKFIAIFDTSQKLRILGLPKQDELAKITYEEPYYLHRLRFSGNGEYLTIGGTTNTDKLLWKVQCASDGQFQSLEPVLLPSKGFEAIVDSEGRRVVWFESPDDVAAPVSAWKMSLPDSTPERMTNSIKVDNRLSQTGMLDSDHLCLLSSDKRVEIWDLRSDSLVTRSQETHNGPLAVSPCGNFVLCNHALLDAKELATVVDFPILGHTRANAFSSDGQQVVFAYQERACRIWRLDRLNQSLARIQLPTATPSPDPTKRMQLLPASDFVANETTDQRITVLDYEQALVAKRTAMSAENWTAANAELGKVNAESEPTTVIKLLLDCGQRYPYGKCRDSAQSLVQWTQGILANYASGNPQQWDKLVNAVREQSASLREPTLVTKLICAVAHKDFAAKLKDVDPQQVSIHLKLAESLCRSVWDSGELDPDVAGDRWYWILYQCADYYAVHGDLKRAIELKEEAHSVLEQLSSRIEPTHLAQQYLKLKSWREQLALGLQQPVEQRAKDPLQWWLEYRGPGHSKVTGIDQGVEFLTNDNDSTPVTWQLSGLSLKDELYYEVSMEVRSSRPIDFNVGLYQNQPDWTNVGLFENVRASPEFTLHRFTFKATAPAVNNRLDIVYSSEQATLAFRNLRIIELPQEQLDASDRLPPGQSADYLNQSIPAASDSTVVAKADQKWIHIFNGDAQGHIENADGEFRFTVINPGQKVWHAQFTITNLSLVEGKSYSVYFEAKANDRTPWRLAVTKDEQPYSAIGLQKDFEISPEYASYHLTFEASGTATNNRVLFEHGLQPGELAIRNFQMMEIPDDSVDNKESLPPDND